jgi:hypothetical protein
VAGMGFFRMAQGKAENILIRNLLEKEHAVTLRPWQLRTIIAPFGIIDMQIDHTKVRSGEIVNVTFKAVNTADFTTIYPITLKINYEVVAAEVISIPQKSIVPMKFTVAQTIPGRYRIDINNSIEIFTVIGNPIENEIAKIEGFGSDVSTIEANLDFNSRTSEQQQTQREITVINAKLAPVKQQKKHEPRQNQHSQNIFQAGINTAANFIEKGLDTTGDAIAYPIDKLNKLPSSILKILKKK